MQYYTWILTFHIMAFMSWMAMLFYLPRMFVYHMENIKNKEYIKVAKIQEDKLYRLIGVPAMWASILSGITMIGLNPQVFQTGGWIHAKLTVVVLLIAYSYSLSYYLKQLKNDTCTKSGKFFRAYNELPTLLAILIVTYAITKEVSLIFSVGIICLFIFISYMIIKKK